MAFSYEDKTAIAAQVVYTFAFTFGFLTEDQIKVYYQNVATLEWELQDSALWFLGSLSSIEFFVAPQDPGVVDNIRIRREVDKSKTYSTFPSGGSYDRETVFNSFKTDLYLIHEVLDGFTGEDSVTAAAILDLQQRVLFLEEQDPNAQAVQSAAEAAASALEALGYRDDAAALAVDMGPSNPLPIGAQDPGTDDSLYSAADHVHQVRGSSPLVDGAEINTDASLGLVFPVTLSQTDLTSGAVVVTHKYFTETFETGDDFSNVADIGAAANVTGAEWTAIDTDPTDWTNGSNVRRIPILKNPSDMLIGEQYTWYIIQPAGGGVRVGFDTYFKGSLKIGTDPDQVTVIKGTTLSASLIQCERIGGAILQVATGVIGSGMVSAAQFPVDTSIPQISEGSFVHEKPFVPVSDTSRILVLLQMNAAELTNVGNDAGIGLFIDTQTDAIKVVNPGGIYPNNQNFTGAPIFADISSWGKVQQKFSIRVSCSTTCGYNYHISANTTNPTLLYGAAGHSLITIIEYED